jgi:DNA-binding NarL/FixJ family response regulator
MYTVKFHVASILAKLHAGSRTEAVTLGVRGGLISL